MLAPAYLIWCWSDQLGNLGGDAANYLMQAQVYTPFVAHDALFSEIAATSRFPPLYPLWLAITGSAQDLVAVHVATAATLFAALWGLYAWLAGYGASRGQAALLVALVALMPQTYFLALWPQSEYLYLLCSVVSLVALNRYRVNGTFRAVLIAALAAACAMLTRSIGIALLPALAVALLERRSRHGWLLAVVIGPALIWAQLHPSPSNYPHTLLAVYGGGSPVRLWIQLSGAPRLFGSAFGGNLAQSGSLAGVASVFGLAALAASLWRLWKREPDAIYIACYLAILALWPFPEEAIRLLWPVMPLMVGSLMLEASAVVHRYSSKMSEVAGAAVVGALILTSLPTLLFTLDRWQFAGDGAVGLRHLPEWYQPDPRRAIDTSRSHIAMVDALQRVSTIVPADDCVVTVKPELVEYFARRRGTRPPLNSVPDADFLARVTASGCSYVLMLGARDAIYPVALHPYSRIKNDIDIADQEVIQSVNAQDELIVALLGRLRDTPSK